MYKKGYRFIVLKLLLVIGMHTYAQNLTQSPYSVIGMGETHFSGNNQLSAMGQTSQGYRRPFEINTLNPASYSSLQQTVFEVGYLYSSGTLNSSTSSTKIDNASFAYFNLGIPISIKHGISLIAGLQPYSSIGYNVNSSKAYQAEPDSPSYIGTTQMQGRGGLSKFMIGTSFRLHKNLSIGVNINYLFGTIERNQQLSFDTSTYKFNIAQERKYIVNDFFYQLGLQFHKSLSEKYKLNLGVTYSFQSNLSSRYDFTTRSLGWGGTAPFTLDTIDYSTNTKGTIILPQAIKAGFSFEKKGVWMIASDINYTQWTAYKSFGVGDNLKNSTSYSFGASWIPDQNATKGYLNKIEYRIGGRYDNGNVQLYAKNISSYALTGGLGFPLGKTKSRLNASFEYISKGTTSSGLIREDLFRVIIGVTFSDQWFVRYKYD